MKKDKESVFMCMSCGNCKRKDGADNMFSFYCSCGEFIVDAIFASRIEFVGCRSWLPASDDFNEPYIIKLDEKHKTVEIGRWGKEFKSIDADELSNICGFYENDDDGFSAMINECRDVYGE